MIGSKSYNRVMNKINKMGLSINPLVFIYMRLISSLLLFVGLLFLVDYGYIIAPLVTIIYYVFIEVVVLDFSIKVRIKEIEYDALDFMPIFLLSLKSGRNVKKALVYTTDIVDNTLSSEFKKVLYDEKIGKSLDESLMDMKYRIPSDLVANMIISVIEANRLGNNISDSINNQLSYIEGRRNKKIFTSYKVVPFKMAIISILFVFIIMFFLILCV